MGNEISRWRATLKERRRKHKTNSHFLEDPLQAQSCDSPARLNGQHIERSSSGPPIRAKPTPPSPEPSMIKVRALYNFPGVNEDDLPFNKGDILEVDETLATEENGWWLATHLKTRQSGYIPYNYVVKADTTPETQEWYFDFDRHDADKILLLPGNKKGTFLIRKATDGASYVLSVLDIDNKGEPESRHYRIRNMDNGAGFFISHGKIFKDMFALVEHCRQKNSTGLCCPLSYPCPRIRPSLQFRDLEVDREAVKLSVKLGGGNFGEVWKGKFRKVVDVAVKTVQSGKMTSEAFLEEAKIMHSLTHHRLVLLMAVVSNSEPFYIITELMPNGSLVEFLRSAAGKQLKLRQLIAMNAQVAEGMAYLESKNYIHRDLRAANILVGERFDVKVADFGLARFLNAEIYNAEQNTKFPIKWTAPEAAIYRKFSTKSDVWSFGVLMYEIITFGRVPYPGVNSADVLKMVEAGDRMSKPKSGPVEVPDSYYDMMLKCWRHQPEERPTFEAIFDFFDNYFVSVEPNYKHTDD